jgi:hypothetical protein
MYVCNMYHNNRHNYTPYTAYTAYTHIYSYDAYTLIIFHHLSVRNKDGLTCYEGLGAKELEYL